MRQLLPSSRVGAAQGAAPPWERLAGPDALGRNLVVLAGGDVAAPWRDCPVVVLDQAVIRSPAAAVGRMRASSAARERLVVELHAEFEQPPGQVERRPAHEIGPRFTFELDELHHLVWSNSVDARWPNARALAPDPPGGRAGCHCGDRCRCRSPQWRRGLARRWAAPVHASARRRGRRAPADARARLARPVRRRTPPRLISRPTSWLPSLTSVARPGSSHRPGRARRGCSPSALVTC